MVGKILLRVQFPVYALPENHPAGTAALLSVGSRALRGRREKSLRMLTLEDSETALERSITEVGFRYSSASSLEDGVDQDQFAIFNFLARRDQEVVSDLGRVKAELEISNAIENALGTSMGAIRNAEWLREYASCVVEETPIGVQRLEWSEGIILRLFMPAVCVVFVARSIEESLALSILEDLQRLDRDRLARLSQ